MIGAGMSPAMKLKRAIADLVERLMTRDIAAVKCLQHDAKQGQAHAQSALGDMYTKGTLVPKNDAKAAQWYRRAAEQGDAHAQLNLGASYAAGRGVPQDDADAVKWYRLAADQGDALAQFYLGGMYSSGRGVPQNCVLALMWLDVSSARGIQSAAIHRDQLTRSMDPAQIAVARDLAREWRTAKQWLAEAMAAGAPSHPLQPANQPSGLEPARPRSRTSKRVTASS